MDIQFKVGDITYKGTMTSIPKEREFHYFFDLGEGLQFTIRPGDDTEWETDNRDIDPELVQAAGDQVEKIENAEEA